VRFDLRLLGPTYIDDFESGEIDVLVIPEVFSSDKHPCEPLFSDTFSVPCGKVILSSQTT
jgi:hypothetical protein